MADAASEATLNTGREQARATSTPATVPRWLFFVPVVATVLLIVVASQRGDSRLHMWVLDVGQGDSIFLRTPRGHVVLVDGGPGATPVLNGIGQHLPFWQHNIDLLVLTHPHEDHMMGLIDVLRRYRVGEVVETVFTGTFGVQGEWLRATGAAGVPVHYARRGDTISFEDEPDLTMDVLSPATPDAREELGNGGVNNTSVVIKVQYGQEGILLEGDAQAEAEGEMESDTPGELRSAVLKVGHHGSDTSSTPAFLAAVRPSIAVISVGVGNKYKHPAQTTLDALQQVGAKIYRTDENGTVEIIAEKDKMWVRSER